jgi:hypothetical protein
VVAVGVPVVVGPVVLGPVVLGPVVLGPVVLGPVVLGPVVLGPVVLGPVVLGPVVLGPVVLGPVVLVVDPVVTRRRGNAFDSWRFPASGESPVVEITGATAPSACGSLERVARPTPKAAVNRSSAPSADMPSIRGVKAPQRREEPDSHKTGAGH